MIPISPQPAGASSGKPRASGDDPAGYGPAWEREL